jgi:5-methylcytosine-specific restriction endonuclease McrA
MLLTRDEFRKQVFERDNYRCVICGAKNGDKHVKLDAHHIIERRLWADGGYYLENGATPFVMMYGSRNHETNEIQTILS